MTKVICSLNGKNVLLLIIVQERSLGNSPRVQKLIKFTYILNYMLNVNMITIWRVSTCKFVSSVAKIGFLGPWSYRNPGPNQFSFLNILEQYMRSIVNSSSSLFCNVQKSRNKIRNNIRPRNLLSLY